ncbi:uncharacterized protein LOC131228933 [Magnolia sinica]|uniref:uncharacterized protein LOC131228933 n=1 Tax=Magnolia sinica TaxID=86752 RepID=UPI0026599B55|nr:uncharacterized protein LOC131228933 [Magnolia sinica]
MELGRTSHLQRITPCVIFWEIWKARNTARFDGTKIHAPSITDNVKRCLLSLASLFPDVLHPPAYSFPRADLGMSSLRQVSSPLIVVRWQIPPTGWNKLNVDGSTIENPGPSGGGGLCRNDRGDFISGFLAGYGPGSNVYAKLRAIHDGLTHCVTLGLQNIIVESDSKLVVDFLNGLAKPSWKWSY